MHVLAVGAARPNFMKVKPTVDAFDRAGFRTTLVHTGQHFDPSMSDVFFEELGLRAPDHHLGVSGGSHAEQTASVMLAFEPVLDATSPDFLVVFGDVNATVACSLVAAKLGVPIAHVEAGLRSRDWAMPEEINRVVTDRISDLLLTPSEDASDNLRREGYREDQVVLVGNVMIDTLLANVDRASARVEENGLRPAEPYAVLTLHRPSNVDATDDLRQVLAPIAELSAQVPVLFPVHPRTRKNLASIALPPTVHLLDPLGYLDFIGLLAGASVVLTDSGGIQEETTVLGVPCLTLRDNTERPITIEMGTNVLVGRDREQIIRGADAALSGHVVARRPPLWDGKAADRISAAIAAWSGAKRPTDL